MIDERISVIQIEFSTNSLTKILFNEDDVFEIQCNQSNKKQKLLFDEFEMKNKKLRKFENVKNT